jgi:RimJ/RimL family protein N-acetyltransferase
MIYRIKTVEEVKKCIPLVETLYKEVKCPNKNFNSFKKIWLETWSKEISSNDKLGKKAFVVEENGEIIGFFGFTVYVNELDGVLSSQEHGWFVKEGKRGLGIKLLKKSESYAKALGCKRFSIGHAHPAHPTENLMKIYERMGFEHEATIYTKKF